MRMVEVLAPFEGGRRRALSLGAVFGSPTMGSFDQSGIEGNDIHEGSETGGFLDQLKT